MNLKIISDKLKILSDHLTLIIIAFISIIMVIIVAILISISFGGEIVRQPIITEIRGEAYIYRGGSKLLANKKFKIASGDIIYTDKDSSIRIMVDFDKYIAVEEKSSIVLYYTDISDKGSIDVSISEGSVICQLNNALKKKEFFNVKTPNSVVDVKGTVFRTSFNFAEKYLNYENVYVTEVQNFDGTVNIQLYDYNGNSVDLPMLLIERTSARMITAENISQYLYLNHDTDLYSLSERSLIELLRISTEKKIAYATEELNTAYKAVLKNNLTETAPIFESEIETTSPAFETSGVHSSSEVTVPTETTVSESSGTNTLATTRETHVYTTFSGERWWEIQNNGSTDIYSEEDFDDGGVFSDSDAAVTSVPSEFEELETDSESIYETSLSIP